jgi:cellulose synthase operon protein YhjQ
MTDRGPLHDQNDTPEDVASLYSWANLHGAKYRDFSEARAQTREKARQRVQQAIEEEQARLQKQAQAERSANVQRAAESSRLEEQDRQAQWAAERAAQVAAQHAAEEAAMRQAAVREAAEREAAIRDAAQHQAIREAERQQQAVREQQVQHEQVQHERVQHEWNAERVQQANAAWIAAEQQTGQQPKEESAPQRPVTEQQPAIPQQPVWGPLADRFPDFAAADPGLRPEQHTEPPAAQASTQHIPPQREYPTHAERQPSWPGIPSAPAPAEQAAPTATAARHTAMHESYEPPSSSWAQGVALRPEQPAPSVRPAWLTPERPEAPGAAPPAPPAEDTLQGSRDRLASRWYALRGVFDGISAQPETAPAAPPARAPAVAVFSLAGGVGKTSLVATLGRALSSRGERVLLIDTAPYGLMPFFFGAHDQRPGVLRTFSPPGTSGDAPIQMVTIDPDTLGPETAAVEAMSSEIAKYSRGVSRIIVDLATASGATTRRVLRMSPLVLVPMMPDMNSVVSVSSIDSFFQHNFSPNSKQVMPFYILNQFDSSLPLHLDIREILREQLGDRLLTIALRRAPAVSEALAEGMTVMDYAPNSTVAEDFANLAGWVKSQSAPASSAYRGVRWSER